MPVGVIPLSGGPVRVTFHSPAPGVPPGDGDGDALGEPVGDGDALGEPVGDGDALGEPVGDGDALGEPVGDGDALGEPVGDGDALGEPVGDGDALGEPVGDGDALGEPLGEPLGEGDGDGGGFAEKIPDEIVDAPCLTWMVEPILTTGTLWPLLVSNISVALPRLSTVALPAVPPLTTTVREVPDARLIELA